MPDMQHPGVSATATQTSPGNYDDTLKFSMTGGWTGSVIVADGGRTVAVPISFEVT